MRTRTTRCIDRSTGETVETQEILPNATWDERLKQLKSSLPPIGKVEARVAIVKCDQCWKTENVDFEVPQLPDGWVEHSEGDFCPACAKDRGLN